MLRPLNDIVMVEMDEDTVMDNDPRIHSAIKSGLIVIPDKNSVMKVANTGTVLSKGNKCSDLFKVGDRILFQSFGGITLNWEGKRLRMLREQELNAVIE